MMVTRRNMMLMLLGMMAVPPAFSRIKAKIIIIGGGFGGATAARKLRQLLPHADISLVEPKANYYACPFSNLVIAGAREIEQQKFGYRSLQAEDIKIIPQAAYEIDPVQQIVTLANGNVLSYDRLLLSPGIDFRFDAIDGYTASSIQSMPHAWQAGGQTRLLQQQLQAMPENGLVIISAPAPPYRCPPGPYERASLIAHYLQHHKPRAKLIILDSKDRFSKKPLFLEGWKQLYGDLIEWRGASDDGRVVRVESEERIFHTEFETIKADVGNFIPPQQAALIAKRAGVTDGSGWCPINAISFESELQPLIHIIGDAAIAAPMPKSAFAANMQAKLCAIQIARLLSGFAPEASFLANTCYSYLSPDAAISVAGVYDNQAKTFSEVKRAGGISALAASPADRKREAQAAHDWFSAITYEAFG